MAEEANNLNDTPQETSDMGTSGTKQNTGMAVLAYIIFFIPLLTDAKEDPYVKYHVKQGIVLFISWIAIWIFSMVPVVGWLLALPLNIFLLILLIMGVLNAVNGNRKPLPLIGQYAKKINL